MIRFEDEDLPPELSYVADQLRSHRYEASALELDQAKTRILKRAGGQRVARGGFMGRRSWLTAIIMFAAIGTGSAGALALSGHAKLLGLSSHHAARHHAVRQVAATTPPAAALSFQPSPSASGEQYEVSPTVTVLSCTPPFRVNQTISCTVQVISTAGQPAPTGTVTLTGSGPGTGSSCTLGPFSATVSTCTLTYTPTAKGNQFLTAHYLGDATHTPSTSGVFAINPI
ncbi:MAG: Ig-like domain-containing protein [Solirubrobacteraceae bacterium]